MSPIQIANLMSKNPAEIYNIKNKGKIAIGYNADFTVINPKKKRIRITHKYKNYIFRWRGGIWEI